MLETVQSEALAGLFAKLVPECVLVVTACVLFLGGAIRPCRQTWNVTALIGLAMSLLAHWFGPAVVPAGEAVSVVPILTDSLANWTRALAICSGIVLVLASWNESPERQTADYLACLLIILAGVGLVGASNDLVAMFLALEMISIPTYVLLYLPRHDDRAQESAMKYFVLSALSSAFLLFGFSYLFGIAGSTNLSAILDVLARATPEESASVHGLAQVAMLWIVAGLGFRITAVPFHFYAPDVYQGTSAGAAAMLALIPKIAGFVALIRLFGFVVPEGVHAVSFVGRFVSDQLPIFLWFLAAFTMTAGNVLALLQDNLKRMLAYSGVAHGGYMLMALATAPYLEREEAGGAIAALLFYLVAYGAMTVGMFSAIAMLDTPDRPVDSVDDLGGLGEVRPGLALLIACFLFSLTGIPLFAGFTGKFLVFFSAVSVPGSVAWLYVLLAVIGVLNAAIGGWYYLRIVAAMYLRPSVKPITTPGHWANWAALGLCLIATLAFSLPPASNWLLGASRLAATTPASASVVAAQGQR